MENLILTKSEQKTFDILLQKSDSVTNRDEIAQSVWGNNWLSKYSDWQIDRLIYLLRKKLPTMYKIKTLRNSGYILSTSDKSIPKIKSTWVEGTLPTQNYLEYMNNTKNLRKVLEDLFKSINLKGKFKKILVINSYSFDNIDAVAKIYKNSEVYFSNFDKRALKIHEERIDELNLTNFKIVEDDIRDSIFNNNLFDLIINDFRLNFNTTNLQNINSIKNMYRILKENGKCIVSVVIDPRYNTNRSKPWTFKAQENLTRFCYTENYYSNLFINSGFKIVKKFDVENGKKWNPLYRRFLLQK
ncbi:MAG: winged helix-turn-helix domain-containing protein [Patescibacteria group bacterium]